MRLTYKFYIKHTEQIDRMMRTANNLYNQALYVFRQRLDAEGTWTWYNDMDKIMKNIPNLEGDFNYRMIKSVLAQQTLRLLDKNVKSYCKSIKDWKKYPDKYRGMPQFPRYKKRRGMFPLMFTYSGCSIKNGILKLSKEIQIPIPQWEKYGDRISSFCQVRLIPNQVNIKVEIIYESKVEEAKVDKSKYASIDLGIDNLATMVTSEGCEIWSGRYLKSYNNRFNKTLARLMSIKDLQGIKRSTKRIQRLYGKRDRYMDDCLHKVSREIVDTLVRKEIGTLVVGYNAGWKQNADMGRVNNQKFVQLPFARLISYLEYKCSMAGIDLKKHEESHTSKCDALAMESIGHHDSYMGRRVKRGLFRSSTGRLINADQNGALNILRKVVGDSEYARIIGSGHSLCPVRHRSPFIRVAGSM